MSTQLINPTDLDLNIAVHQRVAQVPPDVPNEAENKAWGLYWAHKVPPYCTSADAVLPLLEKERSFDVDRTHLADDGEKYRVSLRSRDVQGMASTFPRAACIALLRANGVEVAFSDSQPRQVS